MLSRTLAMIVGLFFAVGHPTADDVLYRYEGNVVPYDESAGWLVYNPCEDPCSESVEGGHFVLRWPEAADIVNYHYWIARVEDPPPPETLWVEWRFRSNHPIPPNFDSCDARFVVRYGGMFELVNMYGDAATSFGGAHFVRALDIDEFHTYRFESLDGINYTIAVDGVIFGIDADDNPNGAHYLQLGGLGGCISDQIPNMVNEWDFVRYGTISYGEQIVASDPPGGFLSACKHAGIDRFTVTFDAANYVYLDDITVETTAAAAPVVVQTRRRENDGAETVEIVLDRPIPMMATTRFTFDDGVAVNVVEYTFAPGDTDGDGDADLLDYSAFPACMTGPDNGPYLEGCRPFDFNADNDIDIHDFTAMHRVFAGS